MRLNRRDVLGLAVGAIALPRVAMAQAAPRRVGALMAIASDDPEANARQAALAKGLAGQGWTAGGNVQIAFRWAGGDADKSQALAHELVDLKPDVLVSQGSPTTVALAALSKTTPIVFGLVSDPVGSGIVTSLGRPPGNVTGITNFDSSVVGKWVQLLYEIDPQLKKVMMLFNPDTSPDGGAFYMQPLMAAAGGLSVEAVASPVRSDDEIEMAIAKFAGPGAAIVGPPDVFVTAHRSAIIQSAALHRVPAVYPYRYFADQGGLMSYGIDTNQVFEQVGDYVGQILNGTKVSDLPIRAPSTFQFVVNLKAAMALGITVPQSVLAQADDVID